MCKSVLESGRVAQENIGGGSPPYAAYAFFNLYNLSLLAAAATVGTATDHLWLLVCAAAVEGIWMIFAPDSRVLRALWFDKKWAEAQGEAARARRAQKYTRLPMHEQPRALGVGQLQARIDQLSAENPSFTVDLLRTELARISALVEDYLDLAFASCRCEEHLQNFGVETLDRRISDYDRSLRSLQQGDPRREVAIQNLEVLRRRRQRYDELTRRVQTGRGQMELLENTLRLIADDIVTMRDASELGERLQELRVNVDAVRDSTLSADDFLALEDASEPEEASEMRR
jgi:hypothetical protein